MHPGLLTSTSIRADTMANPYFILLTFVLTVLLSTMTVDGQEKRCVSYCDINEVKVSAFYCNESSYCCGTLNERYCCTNKTLDISHKYIDVQFCRGSAWFMYSWQVLLGTMGIMVMLIVLAACCCQCCNLKRGGWRDATRARGSRRRQHRSDTELSTINVQDDPQPSFFDPSHPYAFTPPDYESLAKDPPAYSSLFEGGSSNPGFEGHDGGVDPGEGVSVVGRLPEGPPPAYKERADNNTAGQPPPQSGQQPQEAQSQQPQQQQPQQQQLHQQQPSSQQPSPGQTSSSSPETVAESASQHSVSQVSSPIAGHSETNTTPTSPPGGQGQGREEVVRHGSVEDRPHAPAVPDVNQPENNLSNSSRSSPTTTDRRNVNSANGRDTDSRNVFIQAANDNMVNI